MRVSEWSSNYGLNVNPANTQAIIIGSTRMISRVDFINLAPILFNGVLIPYSLQVKNLGVILDRTLSWVPQMNEVSRKMFAAVGSLRRLRNFLPIATKVALAQSLLLPILDYADVSYIDLSEEQLNKLERIQNLCIRFIFGLRKYDHVSSFRSQLKWLPIRSRRNSHFLALLYGILFNPATPRYLKERFKFLSSARSAEKLLLSVPSSNSKFYCNSFTFRAVRLWNSLPIEIKRAKSLPIFKTRLKEYYLSLP